MARVGIVGGGAFGTALACVMRRRGHDIVLWAREPEVVEAINRHRENPRYLRGVALPDGITATGDPAEAVRQAAFVLLAPPAQFMRAVSASLAPHLAGGVPLITCSKGLELGSCALMSQVLAETLPGAPVAVLSGPSFAAEIAAGLPTAVTLACADPALATRLAGEIEGPTFRACLSDDATGAQVGGALKNVIAIACGMAAGLRLGGGMRATLLARGLAETVDLGLALGARLETFLGLSGIGDMDLSCNSAQSRNTSLGMALGEGRSLAEVLGSRVTVQEGVHSVGAVTALAARLGVGMPVATLVDRVVNRGAAPADEIAALLRQPFGVECAVVAWLRRGIGTGLD